MPDITAERMGKVFTNILRNKIRLLTFIAHGCLLQLTGCTPDMYDDPIPYQPFQEIVVNLTLPSYNTLQTTGSQAINGGIRGIIVYKASATSYIAYERNCSYRPNEACATVNIDNTTLFMVDPCCGSTFEFTTGIPRGGVAWRPLRKYQTFLNGSILTISDQVIE